MTRKHAKEVRDFINKTRMLDHILNCLENGDDELSPEECEELLVEWRPLSDLCMDAVPALVKRLKEYERTRKQRKTK